jgi:hypothetical protein
VKISTGYGRPVMTLQSRSTVTGADGTYLFLEYG